MFKSLAISKRVALGISIPLFGLLVVGSVATWDAYKSYQSSVILGYVSEATNELAALTHTLQIERGQSAIIIGSGASTPQLALITARKDTDYEVKLIHTVNEHVHESGDADLIKGLDNLEEELKELSNLRSEIDSGSIASSDAMKHYTTMIIDITDLGFIEAKKANNAELALETVAMLEMAEAKEYADRERGLVASFVASNVISPKNFTTLEKYIGKQETLIENFLLTQPEVTFDYFKKLIDNVDETVVNSIRDQITDAAFGNSEITINAQDWFAASTQRINAFRAIEIEAIKVVDVSAEKVKKGFLNHAIFMGLISLLSLLGAVVTGYFIASSIRKDILRTSDELKALAQGDTSFAISGVGDNTEIGMMAEAIQVFKENALARVKMEAEAETGRVLAEETRAKDEASKAKQQHEVETVVNSLGNALQRLANGDLSRVRTY